MGTEEDSGTIRRGSTRVNVFVDTTEVWDNLFVDGAAWNVILKACRDGILSIYVSSRT